MLRLPWHSFQENYGTIHNVSIFLQISTHFVWTFLEVICTAIQSFWIWYTWTTVQFFISFFFIHFGYAVFVCDQTSENIWKLFPKWLACLDTVYLDHITLIIWTHLHSNLNEEYPPPREWRWLHVLLKSSSHIGTKRAVPKLSEVPFRIHLTWRLVWACHLK